MTDLRTALERLLDACEADFGIPGEYDADDEAVGGGLKDDGSPDPMSITFGHLRDARAALAQPAEAPAGQPVVTDEMVGRASKSLIDWGVKASDQAIKATLKAAQPVERGAVIEECAEVADVVADEKDTMALEATNDADVLAYREQEEGAKEVARRLRALAGAAR